MTDKEREQILKMIEDGKISPEEGLKLIQVLEQEAPEDESPAQETVPGLGSEEWRAEASGMDADPRIARIKSTARRFWQIPLWIGVGVVILSAVGMYGLMQAGHMNFWFYCLIAPLLLGVLVIALAAGTRRARWIFVDVQQKPGEKPQRIFLGFPLPMKFTSWVLRTFGGKIDGLQKSDVKVEQVLQVLEAGLGEDRPLVVNVDEGEEGDRVKVYIG